MKLRGGNHFTWTNAICAGHKMVADCLAATPSAVLINDYGFAFLDTYLRHQSSSLLMGNGSGLSAYAYQQ